MQNKAFSKILVLIILAVLVGGGVLVYQYWWLPKEEAKNHAISEAKIKEISIQKPNLVITGENLSEVQVYIVPTGTSIDRETMSLIENATKQSENNGEQIWTYQYPENLLITNIFVKGFDNNGNFVGEVDLSIVGATALWDALYGNTDETADWQTYKDENVTFKFPSGWTEEPILIRGSGYTKEFKDLENKFSFTFLNNGNYNQVTGKPYENIDEYINMPYQVETVIVDGQEGRQPLPRAGSENINSAVFFSKDLKFIYTLMLKTGNTPFDTPVNDITEGQELFNQILSTFSFFEETCFKGKLEWAIHSDIQEIADEKLQEVITQQIIKELKECGYGSICDIKSFRVSGETVDLNNDEVLEYIIYPFNSCFTGTGGGPIYIFEFIQGEWKLIGDFWGAWARPIKSRWTKGYVNLVTQLNSGTCCHTIYEYVWSGETYELIKTVDWGEGTQNPLGPPEEYWELWEGQG